MVDILVEKDVKEEDCYQKAAIGELLSFLKLDGPEKSLLDDKPDPKTCTAREYVEHYIFPVLLVGIEKTLVAAKANHALERKRTKFNACDFLTGYLYKNNPNFNDRKDAELMDIPFVQESLKRKPRPPLPLSLLWSEEEAAVVIQSCWRGHVARKDPEVQELRQYQKEMRENSYHIMFRVEDFWKQHPVENDGPTE